jgi:diguanylate cyclase (GGDEF)-like protein
METSLAPTAPVIQIGPLNEEIERLLNLARKQHLTHPKKAANTCQQVITLLRESPDLTPQLQEQLADAYLILGKSYQIVCNHQKSLQAFFHALEHAEARQDNQAVGIQLNHIAATEAKLKNFPEALAGAHRVLGIAQKSGDTQLEVQALNTLGSIYLDLAEPFNALSFFQQAFDIMKGSVSPEVLSSTFSNFCLTHLKLGNLDKAFYYGSRAVRIARGNKNYHQLTDALLRVGQVTYARGDTDKALEAYEKALEIARRFQFPCEASTALCLIGRIQLEQKQFREANKILNESLDLTQNFSQHPNYAECHRLLAELHTQQKKYQQALWHHKRYHGSISQRYQRDLTSRVQVLELANNLETANKISEALTEQNKALREEVRLRKLAQARLEEISRLDPLTQLFNRRHFYELAEKEYARAKRYQHPLAAVMIDIDYFKSINDNYGHAIGDQVLSEVASRIAKSAREVDIVGRYGGEEFIILLPETNLENAQTLADRVWHDLTKKPTSTSKLTIPVQVSIGIASFEPSREITLDDLIDHADQALYKAKQHGRNRIEVFAQ